MSTQHLRSTGTDPRPDDVAVVGVAGVFPGARDAATFWENVLAGVDSVSDAPVGRWDPVFFDTDAKGADRFYTRRGGFVDDVATFDPLAFGIMPVTMEAAEPDQLLALGAAAAALADAGDVHERVDPARVAVLLGRGGYLGDGIARLDQRVRTTQQVVEVLRSVLPSVTDVQIAQVKEQFSEALGPEMPEGSIGLVPNLAASRIANRFDFRGPAYTVDAACASSLIAVDQAVDLLRSNRADLVLAGGVHHCHDLTLWSVFSQLRALSPSGGIRPFSQDADGVLIGEGTGILALRRYADALRDGDRVYAVVRGTGVASDGRAASPMSPRTEGQVAAVAAAWRAAGLDPADVGLIEAHGTATPLGDRTELETLRHVFGDAGSGPLAGLGSVKSMIGHAMPAAGAAGLVKAALALHDKVLPPTLHGDDPNEMLARTRFRLIGEAEPWESTRLRLAGVNAFGFGGINAHVVLSEVPSTTGEAAYLGGGRTTTTVVSDAPTDSAAGRYAPAEEDVLLLAGADAADLLEQLDALTASGATSTDAVPVGGPARLAIVDPNQKRLALARKVLTRGTAFRGRNDVWFDPTGLLADRSEVAFLFPGVEPEFNPHVADVATRFDLPWAGLGTDRDGLQSQGTGIVEVGRLLATALGQLGVRPDMVAGHSLGEWTAQIVSGMVPAEHADELIAGLDPDAVEVPDVVFVALGAGAEVAVELAEGLDGAHVSHDNCPRQSVLCAPATVVPEILERAKQRRVMAQELPFRSGFHSPLFAPFVAGIEEQFGRIPLQPADVPIWSATTLEPYPDTPAEILALAGRHLVEQVRFRELTEKLYAHGARAFVQVGSGSLVGFLDDTLRDVDVLAVTALPAPGARVQTTGIGQVRRVAVALWSSGYEVDLAPLGHGSHGVGHVGAGHVGAGHVGVGRIGVRPVPVGDGVPLRLGTTLVRGLDPIEFTPASPPAQQRHHEGLSQQPETMTSASSGPIANEFAALVREATSAAQQVVAAAATARAAHRPVPQPAPSVRHRDRLPEQPVAMTSASERSEQDSPCLLPEAPPPLCPVAAERESVLNLSVEAQPHWRDHAFYPQPDGWDVLEDRFPLVPMTALIEMLAEEARKLVPGSVAASITHVRAFRWLAVEPAVDVTVRATVDAPATAAAQVEHPGSVVVKASIEGHCRAVVRLAAAYPDAPAPAAVPVHGEIERPCAVDRIYADGHLFHGPEYQGIASLEAYGTDGVIGDLVTKPAPGSLLDNAGQLFGLWVASRADKDRLVLPTSVDEFAFFGEHPAPGTTVTCVVNCTELADSHVRADLELSVDGRVWCRITGWEDRRFQSDERLFALLKAPGEHLLALPQPGGWFLTVEGWPDSASREVVMRRFLGQDERVDHMSRNPRAQRARLLGRIAAKDAVRARAYVAGANAAFPAQVTVGNDDTGRPWVHTSLPGNEGVQISIAHTLAGRGSGTGVGVAIATTDHYPGIDVERVTARSETFESTSLTSAEQTLLASLVTAGVDRDRELTRWWAAKEAVAKSLGTGLQGRPRDFEVRDVRATGRDLSLLVREHWIRTTSIHLPAAHTGRTDATRSTAQEEYIVAWTDVTQP